MPTYRILIVEDQREVSRLLHTALNTLEHDLRVVEIPSGEEAVLDSTRKKVDLLVADYRLPGMTGIELMRRIRKNQPKVKVLLITGQSDPQVRKAIAEAGADGYFIKPVSIADFLDAVERHLGLVESILPPEPVAVEEEAPHLPELLAGLRQQLDATAVLLISDSGNILARAGDLPNANVEVPLISSLLLIYSAGQKISRMLGQEVNSSWSVFNGGEYDLIYSPIGQGVSLLIVGKQMIDQKRAMNAVNSVMQTRISIETALRDMSTPVNSRKLQQQASQPVQPAQESGKNGFDLASIFKSAKKKLKASDVNEFWEEAVEKHKAPPKPDKLSFDQAKQLGLTPHDES